MSSEAMCGSCHPLFFCMWGVLWATTHTPSAVSSFTQA